MPPDDRCPATLELWPDRVPTSADGTATDSSGRRVLDAYYTPPELAAALVRWLAEEVELRGARVVEPSCGGGAFVQALRAHGAEVVGVDADPHARGLGMADVGIVGDWLSLPPLHAPPAWVVGNPPYADAEAHIRQALAVADDGVAMLLRLGMLESAGRVPLWAEAMPERVIVLAERPSFTGAGTDSAAYGWYIWRRTPAGRWRRRSARLEVRSWR